HAPAPEPATIGFLLAIDKLDSLRNPRIFTGEAVACQHFKNASGNIDRWRIQHGIVIRERNMLENHFRIVFVEAGPASVLALHSPNPAYCALGHIVLISLPGILHFGESQQYLRR